MEKGYRDYGHDIDNTDSVLEAGLGFAVDLDKPDGFIGRDAVAGEEGRRAADPPAACRCCSPTPSRCCSTPRSCCRDGVPVGYVRAASYGHTLGGAVGLAMVEARRAGRPAPGSTPATWEVEVAGRRYPARRVAAPAVRPDQPEDQGLTRPQPCGTSWSSAPGRPERRRHSARCRRDPTPAC